jgi:cysteine desulfurase/selenocysteine lyase
VVSALPAYEPRFGSGVLGVPEAVPAQASPAVAQGASPYYFLGERHGHPLAADRASNVAPPDGHGSAPSGLDALARLPFAAPEVPRVASPTAGPGVPSTVPSTEPRFYFADAVVLPGGYTTPGRAPAASSVPQADRSAHPAFDVHAVRRDFPVLQERVNGRQLVWFDNAATTHKPQSVIDRISYFYAHENSNIHRAAHELAARATDAYEGARQRVQRFINAPDVNEVIFVRGTTEAINLVAKSWGAQHVGEGDEIIVSHLEHHANIVPWQQRAAAK